MAQIQKPGIPEGTRDLGPDQVRKRNFIFDTIRKVFVKYGFQPLETPAMENLSTLTGKYGEEGDKLLFKILNNGDYMKDVPANLLEQKDSNALVGKLSKRGLRYDLTVPFARYVVMNRHALTFPFKRYQIQPVWRADRPQRGRYREFYQCDADVIGSDSLMYEVELVQIYDEAFGLLGVPVTIKINNRKVLFGMAEAAGIADKFMDMTVSIDKLDKIGLDGVRKELAERGISEESTTKVEEILQTTDLKALRILLADSPTGMAGLEELEYVFAMLDGGKLLQNPLQFDCTLARGLTYYTGCILEVAANGVQMGSIGGGGRYADLTGVFGLSGMSGVGVSFGADRIYDVMEILQVFPDTLNQSVQVMLSAMDEESFAFAFQCLNALRKAGIASELYPETSKLKKQLDYANKRGIPMVAIVGEQERTSGKLMVKDMVLGTQELMGVDLLVSLCFATQLG